MAPKKQSDLEFSERTSNLLRDLLLCISKNEQKIEVLRQFLCSNEMFESYSTFCRLDRNEDGFVAPMDLVNFFRDNGVTDVTEADCYFVFKFFDSDEDGKLTFPEFIQMILPCTHQNLRAEATQRQGIMCRKNDYLSIDVEQDMARLFKAEVMFHREAEEIKQKLESMMEFNFDLCFKTLDPGNLGFLEVKTLDSFFKRTFTKGIQIEDCFAIIRRLDLDCDNKLRFDEFVSGMKSQQPYSKLLIRNQMKKEDAFGKEQEEEKKKKKVLEQKKAKNPEAVKSHNEAMANRFNQIQKFDKDWAEVPGVSPIRCRHEIDLYGVKSGLGKFNPIMVENVNKLLEEEDHAPVPNPQMGMSASKKEATPGKPAKKGAAPAKAAPPAPKEKRTPSKLVLTNKSKKAGPDFSKATVPASFKSKYAEYQVQQQSGIKPRNLVEDFGASPIVANRDVAYDLGSSINDRSQQPFGNLNPAASINFSPSPQENRRDYQQQSPISPAYRPSYTVQATSDRRDTGKYNIRPQNTYDYEPPIINQQPPQQPIDRQGSYPRQQTQTGDPDWMKSLPLQQQQPQPEMGSAISYESREVLERAKIQLSQNQDFNLIDAFRIFDTEGTGNVTTHQIVSGLHQIQCYVSEPDVGSFMKIFDKDMDGRLKYSEFCDAFLPLDNNHANNLAQKPPQAPASTARPNFDMQTKVDYSNVWKTHIQICSAIE